ncbi:MAG TPA: glycosyltransferase family 2 protein [Cryomorphaceae bacterium]|nr:glycosyltransferase family 2 protein [Cryomorphaceae bacterium]
MKVSVIIPVFNLEHLILRAIESVLAQSEVTECIVVDDGSNDGTLEICKAAAKKDSRVSIFMHPKGQNLGVSASRNLGIQKAKSPYIAFLDGDDYYLPGRFEETKLLFDQNPTADAAAEACSTINSDGKIVAITAVKAKVLPEDLFLHMEPFGKGGHFSICALTLKREVFRYTGYFSTSLHLGEDTEWISRLVIRSTVITGNPKKPVVIRGIHTANSSKNSGISQRQKVKSCLVLLKWMVINKLGPKLKQPVVHTALKYHFEANNLNATKSRWKKKIADLKILRLIAYTDPNCRDYPGYKYFKKVVFHQPMESHFNFYQ